jgi:signal transduction histidine kinase/ActR/RegA family two-component response regulator
MRQRLGLGARMVLVIVLVVVGTEMASLAASSRQVDEVVRALEVRRAASVRHAIHVDSNDQLSHLSIAATMLGVHKPLLEALRGNLPPPERRARLHALLGELRSRLALDILEVIDRNGQVIYRAHRPEAHGDTGHPVALAEALAGKLASVTAPGPAGLALRVFAPLGDGPMPVAAVSVGELLDDTFARRLGDKVGAEVSILGPRGEVLASSAPRLQVQPLVNADLVAQALREKQHAVPEPATGQETTVYLAQTLVDQTYVFRVTVDSGPVYASVNQGRRLALGLSLLLCAIAALGLGWLAHRHARRLFSAAAAAPAQGGADEVARLDSAMRAMRSSLALHAAELRRARDAADAANEAKSSFLAHMSHEIRTPMSGVLGMAELLGATPLSAEQERYLQLMRQSGQHMMAVLDGVLDLSKIEAGRLELESRPFDPRQTVQAGVDLMAPAAARKGLALSLQVEAGLPTQQLGDALRLQQVLHNLLGNAIKFTASGAVRVALTAAPELGEGGWRLAVTDTGPGIAPQAIERLFQPFTQVDSSTTRQYGGSGLGLVISRRIVEAMGGTLTVASEPGRGATFTATFKLDALPGTAAAAAASNDAAQETPVPTTPGSLHVLLVEDHPVTQRYGHDLLTQLGHRVSVADNGLHAVQLAGQTQHDLILMDLHMPQQDGYEATRQIRDMEAARGEPRRWIVALTANARPEERQRCFDAGMDAVMAKPYTRAQMVALLLRGPQLEPQSG